MTDRFSTTASSLSSPATTAFSITPNDATSLAETTRALFVAGEGALSVRMQSGQTVLFAAVPAGSLLPLRVDRVMATGTTATGIVGLV